MKDNYSDPDAPTPIDHPRVVVTRKGPNLVYGVSVEVEGLIHEPDPHKPFALCACGLSSNKPFCDGSHKLCNDTMDPRASRATSDGHSRRKEIK